MKNKQMKRSFFLIIVFLSIISNTKAQWVTQNSGTTNELRSVYFTSADTGYVVGWKGTILKTTNGGNDWISISTDTTYNYFSCFFINSDTGYVMGGLGSTRVFKKTLNGGNTWTTRTISGGDPFIASHFLRYDTGYTVNNLGFIYKTTNGGNAFTQYLCGTGGVSLNSVFFTSDNTGYISGSNGYFAKTIDGGLTWTHRLLGIAPQSIYFSTDSIGYVVGQNGFMNEIYKTIDAGTTWTLQPTSEYCKNLRSVFFVNSNFGCTVGQGDIAITSNGGEYWSVFPNVGSLFSVFFPTTNIGYAVGETGKIVKTTNGLAMGMNKNENTSKEFLIYPNPATDILTIENLAIIKNGSITIVNIQGQLIMQQYINQEKTNIDISNLEKGVYILKISNANGATIKKISKE